MKVTLLTVTNNNPAGSGPSDAAIARMVDFLFEEKEADLECPVFLETPKAPIYMCVKTQLICSNCRPRVLKCPECRVIYSGPPRRHRVAEKLAEELRVEVSQLTEIFVSVFDVSPV